MAYDQATTYETIELFGLTEKDAHLPIPQDDILKDSIIREAFETLLGQLRNTGLEGEIEPLAHGLATILQRRKVALGKEVDRTADKIGPKRIETSRLACFQCGVAAPISADRHLHA